MKIGVITFHYAHNYGAVLQTYALKTYLNEQGFEVQIINYKNDYIAERYKEKLRCPYGAKDLRHVRLWKKIIDSYTDTMVAQSHWKKQCEKFKNFIDEILLENNKQCLNNHDVENINVDFFVAGSDQIWNAGLTNGIDKIYFLDFPTKAKKVFYGVSNGQSAIPENQIEFYNRVLKDAYGISTREGGLAESIKQKCGKMTSHVLDPTLLLDSPSYMKLMEKVELKERFVFAYFISEDDRMMEVANYIARVLKVKLIELHYYKTKKLSGKDQRADIGPKDFLFYVNNAEFVVTNSFHGTVFSVIFQKKFYSIYGNDSRKDGLLEGLGLTTRHIIKCSEVDLNEEIDYEQVQLKLNDLRKESEAYLENVLHE